MTEQRKPNDTHREIAESMVSVTEIRIANGEVRGYRLHQVGARVIETLRWKRTVEDARCRVVNAIARSLADNDVARRLGVLEECIDEYESWYGFEADPNCADAIRKLGSK